MNCELEDKIWDVRPTDFETLALSIFRYQYHQIAVYKLFADATGKSPDAVQTMEQIPFLPIHFFKTHSVIAAGIQPEIIFESSGTTHTGNSRHMVRSLAVYERSFIKTFEMFYGDISSWCIVGLLPSYLERQHSSLVLMVDQLIKRSGNKDSAFYLYEYDQIASLITSNEKASQKTLLIGVTYALLDFSEKFLLPLSFTTIMETGGMKGRKKEITREEVHARLSASWNQQAIHAEYGMTELLSQAYSRGNGIFQCPPWMKLLLREEDDPLSIKKRKHHPVSGLVNIIDLANIYSCSFIATDDLGVLHPDHRFKIAGRMDSSDIRGCSLMYP